MELVEYYKLSDLEKNYWWHRGKLYLIQTLLDSVFSGRNNLRILEIGSGTGFISKSIQKYGKVTYIEISKEANLYAKENGIKDVIESDFNKIEISNDLKSKFDLVIALDVLEHIQDDTETMKRVKQVLKKDGYFIVNVPAHKFLWSEHDEALHHKRRYSKTEIVKKLADNGFVIEKCSFFVVTFFPLIWAYRTYTSFFTSSTYPKTSYVMLPKLINDLMTKVLEVESKLIKYFNLPMGTTISIIAKSKE